MMNMHMHRPRYFLAVSSLACLLTGASDVIDATADYTVADDAVKILDAQSFIETSKENRYLLLFFNSKANDCPTCRAALALVKRAANNGVPVYSTRSRSLAEGFSVTSLPAVVYVRNGEPALYDGVFEGPDAQDDLEEWLETTKPTCSQNLTDETFEHLTQASSGATTGDWLVLFHAPECEQLSAVVESVCHRVKQRMNVARAYRPLNPETHRRFAVQACPQLIFFRHGKLYRYELDDFSVTSLVGFATSWYRNATPQPVPLLKSPFDQLVESIVKQLKIQSQSVNTPVIIAVGLLVVVIIAVISVKIFRSPRQPHKHTD